MAGGISKHRASNKAYLLKVIQDIEEMPHEILASAAISGFKAAVKHTYKDSGQFAMNWRISPSGSGRIPAPVYYSRKSGYPKSRSGGGESFAYDHVMQTHGIPERENAPLKDSRTFRDIVGKKSTKVSISNPFYNTGKYGPYPYRAAINYNVEMHIKSAITQAAYRAAKRWDK